MRSHINAPAFMIFCVRDSAPATTPLNLNLTFFKIYIIPFERFNLTNSHTRAQTTEHMRVIIAIHKNFGLVKQLVGFFFR